MLNTHSLHTYVCVHFMCRSFGVDVALLTPEELQKRFPWLNTDGVALASLGMYVSTCTHVYVYMHTYIFVHSIFHVHTLSLYPQYLRTGHNIVCMCVGVGVGVDR